MDFTDVESLVPRIAALMREHDLAEIELEGDGLRVRLRREARVGHSDSQSLQVTRGGSDNTATDVSVVVVSAPVVGTFYRSAEPTATPFVEVGDRVRRGDVLCIIEAMKQMNDITSHYAGQVVAIQAENGEAVEFGAQLFAIKIDG
ncbi:MAG: biotin/lipoyl-containing protein [Acidobacteriota bacterium]|nr:biotin/lipoyl-containing protein [Acidobacteriota bacterium]